jgi:MYXO-CTERM domain-containing protein
MRATIVLMIASAIIATPALAQDNNAANATTVDNVAATDVNVTDITISNDAANGIVAEPVAAPPPTDVATVDTGYTPPARNRGFPWGLLGLLGIAGLLGHSRRSRGESDRTS